MNPVRREAIRNAIEAAKRNHARRSHLQHQLTLATVEQLQSECPVERDWPTLVGLGLREAARIAFTCLIVACVLVYAFGLPGVK